MWKSKNSHIFMLVGGAGRIMSYPLHRDGVSFKIHAHFITSA